MVDSGMLEPDETTLAALAALNPPPSESQIAELTAFLGRLERVNRDFNLTRVTEPAAMWQRHILDSLSLLPELPDAGRVADLGSGGGLPAIPLAILRRDLKFTMVESATKKAVFLKSTAEDLGLNHVHTRDERVETLGRGELRATFDVVSARALARMPVLLELALPLLREGGLLLAIKGEQADAEIAEAEAALGILGGEVEGTRRTETGTIVRIRKRTKTPAKYPRRPGEPKRNPLC